MEPIRKLVLLGTGLIAGSFSLALKRAGLVEHVVGVGRSPENLQRGQLSLSWLMGQIHALGFEGAQDVLLLCLNTQGMLLAQGKGRTQVQTHQALPPQKVVW